VVGVCVLTDGVGCVVAGLTDLDANVVSNDAEAVLHPCSAAVEERKTLAQVAIAGLSLGVPSATTTIPSTALAQLGETTSGKIAVGQLNGLSAGTGAAAGLGVAAQYTTSCGCSP
jgi:hypothetical protein